MNKSNSKLWVTWEQQRRNPELANATNSDYLLISVTSRWLRYPISCSRTLWRILFGSYDVVFAQCPSVVLIFIVALARTVKNFVFVIDAHNAMFDYLESDNSLLRMLTKFAVKKSDFVIVTNNLLTQRVEQFGTKALIIPDRLPNIPEHPLPARFADLARPIITLISSYAPDEPIELFLQTARDWSTQSTLLVTGKKSRAGELLSFASDKIHFTDFLSDEEFEGLIRHSDLLVDLTTRDDCLVCGAYEALSVGVPALLSDSPVLRETFGAGAVYAKNSAEDYRKQLEFFFEQEEEIKHQTKLHKDEFLRRWNALFEAAISEIERVQTGAA